MLKQKKNDKKSMDYDPGENKQPNNQHLVSRDSKRLANKEKCRRRHKEQDGLHKEQKIQELSSILTTIQVLTVGLTTFQRYVNSEVKEIQFLNSRLIDFRITYEQLQLRELKINTKFR